VNRKRVRRIWRQEGLQVKTRKRRRRAGRRAPGHVAPSRPNQVWAMDFQFDDNDTGGDRPTARKVRHGCLTSRAVDASRLGYESAGRAAA